MPGDYLLKYYLADYNSRIKLVRFILNFGCRLVCESLLESEKLVYKNAKFWISSFVLMRKIITDVDYKGVREIMKVKLLDKDVFSCVLIFVIILNFRLAWISWQCFQIKLHQFICHNLMQSSGFYI